MTNYNCSDLCYLCGESLGNQKVNEDHVVQKQFIRRNQPKVKGFHYAGTLFTHENCNNKFGGNIERMCQKALQLLNALYSDKVLYREHKDNPDIKVVAIRSDALSSFSKEDKEYFGLIDIQDDFFKNPTAFLANKRKINLFKKPVNIALSVLAKSSAGFLIKYRKIPLIPKWRILAIPYRDVNNSVDLDEIFGYTKPFEAGIKLYAKAFTNRTYNRDWFLAYKANNFIALFCLGLTDDLFNFEITAKGFSDAEHLFFESNRLIDLIDYDWSSNGFYNYINYTVQSIYEYIG